MTTSNNDTKTNNTNTDSNSNSSTDSNMNTNNNTDSKMDDTHSSTNYLIRVSETLPSLEECHSFCNIPSCGAISTFSGITRDNFDSKTVTHLSYEGYIPMAEKELQKLCNEATNQYPSVKRIAAVHILGDCPVGASSVILCASSPHRRDAMHCVEFLIDGLKERVPIWKKEVYQDPDNYGHTSVWKENIEWNHQGKATRVMVKQTDEF
eukprot:CAMPEP_0184860078 /NCGR_PEP_ID=MMETSP0580-20130426/5037_1 /TAXON_ID=1118495 /ORGANISM="Dactyliosolen fragilissimus" /LENGTH=207 /DNA_ID=CAMNT_0027357045 /DNA_START=56 /DNA_END=679 /DNA_ORIENTATION=-